MAVTPNCDGVLGCEGMSTPGIRIGIIPTRPLAVSCLRVLLEASCGVSTAGGSGKTEREKMLCSEVDDGLLAPLAEATVSLSVGIVRIWLSESAACSTWLVPLEYCLLCSPRKAKMERSSSDCSCSSCSIGDRFSIPSGVAERLVGGRITMDDTAGLWRRGGSVMPSRPYTGEFEPTEEASWKTAFLKGACGA